MRHSVIPAVYLILINQDKILLTLRQNTGYKDGEYVVPSGHVEKNEFPSTAMLREAKEEIGIDLKTEDLNFVHVMHRICNDSERVDYYYLVNFKEEYKIKNAEEHKCKAVEWHPINNLPTNTFDYLLVAINAWQNKIPYSESVN